MTDLELAPTWPYPVVAERRPPPLARVWVVIAVAQVPLVVCLLVFMLAADAGFLFPLGILLALNVTGVVLASRGRARVRALWHTGAPCWGRIVERTADVREGTYSVVLRVDAVVTPRNGGSYREAARPSIVRVRVPCHVRSEQMHHVAPGNWCAVLVDPDRPRVAFLDGFVDDAGTFTPIL